MLQKALHDVLAALGLLASALRLGLGHAASLLFLFEAALELLDGEVLLPEVAQVVAVLGPGEANHLPNHAASAAAVAVRKLVLLSLGQDPEFLPAEQDAAPPTTLDLRRSTPSLPHDDPPWVG